MNAFIKLMLFGQQPVAKISDSLLSMLIKRDFEQSADIVTEKFKTVNSDSYKGKNRIAAGILKLAKKDVSALDGLIAKANIDYRDIIMNAEYPRCISLGFDELDKKAMKQIYIDDYIEYSNWLKEKIQQ